MDPQNKPSNAESLVELLEEGFDAVRRDKTVLAGSATACLVHLDAQTEKLQAAKSVSFSDVCKLSVLLTAMYDPTAWATLASR